jgi:hypothetical protein
VRVRLRELLHRVTRRGWQAARAVPGLIDAALDRRYGLATGGRVGLDELGLAAPDRVTYLPSNWLSTRHALRRLRPTRSDVLVDFGSGKGRALVVAGRLPFGRVQGVELAPQLAAIARRNLEVDAPRRRAGEVRVEVADALDYDIPDDMTVAYLYSPFTGPLFEAVVERLLTSVDRNPRRVRLVYNYPREEDYLLSTGRFIEVERTPGNWLGSLSYEPETIVSYEVLGPNAPR